MNAAGEVHSTHSVSVIAELVLNIRRNIRHMHTEMDIGNDRDSRLVDYLNHMDTIAQEIQREMGCLDGD